MGTSWVRTSSRQPPQPLVVPPFSNAKEQTLVRRGRRPDKNELRDGPQMAVWQYALVNVVLRRAKASKLGVTKLDWP